MNNKLTPVSGEMLAEEFLIPLGMSNYRLAKEIGVSAQRIGEIVTGKRAITVDTDLRLCRFLVCQTDGGCAYKWTTISRWRAVRWKKHWRRSDRGQIPKSMGHRPDHCSQWMVSTTIKVRIPGPKSIYVGVIRYITDTLPDPPCSTTRCAAVYFHIL